MQTTICALCFIRVFRQPLPPRRGDDQLQRPAPADPPAIGLCDLPPTCPPTGAATDSGTRPPTYS